MEKELYMDSPIGKLRIEASDEFISAVEFVDDDPCEDSKAIKEYSKILIKAKCQLEEYFKGERKEFTLPLLMMGTEFQKKVWQALIEIPYGETRSYKDIAEKIGCPKGCRAVGLANNKNPLPIVIPCHRVIGSNGKMVGYGGGLSKKETLLRLEKDCI